VTEKKGKGGTGIRHAGIYVAAGDSLRDAFVAPLSQIQALREDKKPGDR